MHLRKDMRFTRIAVWFTVIVFIFSFPAGTLDPFSKQPRVVVEDGHLILRAADNKNISLVSSGNGNIWINKIDFTALSNLLKSLQTEGSVSTNDVDVLGNTVQNIQSLSAAVSSMAEKVERLESNFTTLLNAFNKFIGKGRRKLSNVKVSTYMRKIDTLETRVNELRRLLTTNECNSNPCQHGGTCVDTYNGFICRCPSNWQGPTCSEDVNECALFAGTPDGCQNGATCYNSPGSYRCECAVNWYGIHCSESHDDCSSASHQELCGHGTCINEKRVVPGQAKYRCICDQGWKKGPNGPACDQDVDECAGGRNPCSQNPPVTCINLPGTFHCGPCPNGYSGNGQTCYDINECEVNNGGCSTYPPVECINTIGSRTCGPCPAGYVGNGISCTYVGVCSVNRGGCHPLATCVENTAITGTYRECRCPPGYVGSGEGLTGCTQTQAMSCASNPCRNGTCQMTANSFYCVCFPGFTGTLCDQRADPCYSNPCMNGGTCVSSGNYFTCTCTDLYLGPTCSNMRRFCGGMTFSNSGSLAYPDEEAYRPQKSCVWYIRVDSDKVVNVTFDEFHVSNTDCSTNFLRVSDDLASLHSEQSFRYCANNSPVGKSIQTIRNKFYILLETTSTTPDGMRFSLTWNATAAVCNQELEVATHGSIMSPGYPNSYPSGRDCFWLVRVPNGKRIQFHFATLQLEHHENCSFDFLKIYDGSKDSDHLIGNYCTTASPSPLMTSGSSALLHFHSDMLIVDRGFHITYAAVPGTPGCGGTLTSPSGTINSPNFPDVYENSMLCDWLIRIHPGNKIELKFTSFQTENHADCQFDYVEVYDGTNDAAPLLGRFCGENVPLPLITNSNALFMRFRTDTYVQRTGFRAEYRTICGGTFTDFEGSFSSPYFPDSYPRHVTCYYRISLPQGYLISLNFPVFALEHGHDCTYDYVEIRDGDSEQSKLVGKYCGETAPETFTSTYNQLWLKFNTDGYVQNHGFYANYTSLAIGCGGVFTNDRGFIGTPRHPQFYPPSITCTWLLRAPPGHIIRLSFESFVMERHPQCNFDYVSVQDTGGAKIGKYCGYRTPPMLTSSGNEMTVTFVSDDSVSREGFNASYVFLDATQMCGGNYYVESGVIRSPRFPENYPNNLNCFWVLHAENGHQFVVNVTSFHLEGGDDCKYDFVEIRNGAFETSPLVGRYCGENVLTTFKSHSNKLWIAFQTDSSLAAPGFEMFYDSTTTGCGGSLRTPQGSIVSPNYPQPYGHNAECTWLIQASAGSAVSVVIIDVDIEEHSTCVFDYLEVYDGPNDRSPSLVKMCNNQQNPGPLRSSGSSMYIKFKTDSSGSGRGFHLSYHSLCNNVLKKLRGVIESPNFPNTYPHNHNCTWNISVPMGNNISLAFSHLFMENVTSCDADYVAIYEINNYEMDQTSKQVAKFCGTPFPLPPPIEIGTNMASVRLVTDAYLSREGFRLEYTIKGCGGELTKPYGRITSPNFPYGYPVTTECYWVVKYPPGKRVELSITDFDLEGSLDCVYDYLEAFGGEDENAPRLLKLCQRISQAQTVSSHGNHMTIRFFSDHSVVGKGFSAIYRQTSLGCGGTYTASAATILSPSYPATYNANDECDWLIEVDNIHLVQLEFSEFSLPESVNCSNGYVAIYDGITSSDPLLAKLCGEISGNRMINSTGNVMLVRLRGDGLHVGRGFKAHYKSGCGQRLIADRGGEIRSPNYPHVNHNSPNCSWIISASDPNEKVTLMITHLTAGEGDCSSERSSGVEIRDGDQKDSPLIGFYCGVRVPPSITSQGNSLHVSMQMHAIFRAVYGVTTSFCGGDLSISEGSFASPDYPNDYPMDTECIWTIKASAGGLVQLSFQNFDIEESDYCNMDYVEIHENDAGGALIGRYCGNRIPSNITSASKLWVKFRSDPMGTGKGFLAHYGFVHGVQLNGTEGILESPGYPYAYNPGSYEWTIVVPSPYVVSIEFLEMEIRDSGHRSLCYISVMIYDGFDDTAPEIGEYCGFQIPEPILSHGNQVFIRYETRGHVKDSWKLRWAAVNQTNAIAPSLVNELEPSCWHVIQLNSSSTFELASEGYPEAYPMNMNCTWIFTAASYEHIGIRFDDVQMEGDGISCSFDRVEIYTAASTYTGDWELNATLCGRQTDYIVESPNNLLKVVFISDSSFVMKGFHAVVETICGGTIFGESGAIKSSDIVPYLAAAHASGSQLSCSWILRVRPRRTLQIVSRNFNVPSTSTCSENYILLLNGIRSVSPRLGSGKYCRTNAPPPLETSSNEATVALQVKSFSSGSPQFELHFSEVSVPCGGHLFITEENPSVEIKTPGYPNAPPHPMECTWIIMSPSGTKMRLDIDDELHLSGQCYEGTGDNVEYIEVLDGGSENAEPLSRICYSGIASSIRSTGNTMSVTYYTQSDTHGVGGFKGTITTAECGAVIYNFYGHFTSPNYPDNYTNSLECEWILKIQPGYDMLITIQSMDVPPAENCSLTDYVEIRENNRNGELMGTFCENQLDWNKKTVEIAGSQAYVKFKSDSAYTGKGFSLNFRPFHTPCGGEFSAPTGVITSPNYPQAVGSSRSCVWRIKAKEGRVVTLEFNEFNLPRDETTGVCISSLNILGLPFRYSTRQEKIQLCGNELPAPINVGTGLAYIQFYTHGLAAGQGFSFTYSTLTESECGGILELPSGILSTPNFTTSNNSVADCRWEIDTESDNKTVVFKFDILDIPGHVANYCSDSVLSIYRPRGSYFARFCGNMTDKKPVVTSPYRVTSIGFYAPLNIPFGGIRASYNISECGGVVDAADAVITSPGYPDGYPPNTYCRWLLKSSSNEEVKVTIVDMQLEENCKNDYVLIRDGAHSLSPVIGRFCGRQSAAPIVSDSWYLSIVFHSDEYGTAPGFKITTAEVQHGCGGLIHKAKGVITSPNYPSSYDNDQECVWTIELTPGSLVSLTFKERFDIEMDRTCSKDYILIEDYVEGSWQEVKTLCGRENPGNFVSRSAKMRITFHSDSQVRGDGFKLEYSTACGGHFTDKKGVIYSPNYPNTYPNNLNCTFIVGDNQHYLSIVFDPDSFSIEDETSCNYDFVEIYRGNTTAAPVEGKFCGTQAPPPLLVFGQALVLFKTDGSYAAHGFVMHYEITDCGGYLTDPAGVIHTPKNPQQYLNEMDCTWVIQGQENRVIVIKFISFELESVYSCSFDSLKIYDGNSTDSPLLGKLCGKELPPIIKSSSNFMTIQFTSDRSQTFKGFELAYRNTFGIPQNCGGVISSATGEFSSLDFDKDGKYEPNLDCSWKLIGSVDQVVKITFTQFDVEPSENGTCNYDYVEIRDGLSAQDPVIGRYCGSDKLATITASTNKVTVVFHSDNQENRQGFTATFTSVPSVCGPTLLYVSNFSQTLKSPNYPSPYPPNLFCRWHFSVNNIYMQWIQVVFSEMDVPCGGGDYLNVNSENAMIPPFKLCGPSHPHSFVSPHGLWLSFNSDSEGSGKGFSLTYELASCSRNHTTENGVLDSPWFPLGYSHEQSCIIYIKTSPGRTISMYFGLFNIYEGPGSQNCANASFKVYDGETRASPLLANLCGRSLPNPIFSSGHSLFINITKKYFPVHYFISYTTTDKGRGCGGSLTHANGTFSSPLYPSPYTVTTSCDWKVTVPGRHTMMLYFDFFALSSTAGCDSNFVEIYEGSEAVVAKRIRRMCGNDTPAPYHSLSNQVLVRLVTNSSNSLPGFLARFAMNAIEKESSASYVVQATPAESGYEEENGVVYISATA